MILYNIHTHTHTHTHTIKHMEEMAENNGCNIRFTLKLTFTCLNAVTICMFNMWVAESPTLPGPSSRRSATTESTGFLDDAALGTCMDDCFCRSGGHW